MPVTISHRIYLEKNESKKSLKQNRSTHCKFAEDAQYNKNLSLYPSSRHTVPDVLLRPRWSGPGGRRPPGKWQTKRRPPPPSGNRGRLCLEICRGMAPGQTTTKRTPLADVWLDPQNFVLML